MTEELAQGEILFQVCQTFDRLPSRSTDSVLELDQSE